MIYVIAFALTIGIAAGYFPWAKERELRRKNEDEE